MGNFQHKLKQGGTTISTERSMGIVGKAIPGMGKEIPKAEAYNSYGDAARKVEINALWGIILL